MAKNLADFSVRVNLKGWSIKKYGVCREGQEFNGEAILPRMVESMEAKETFLDANGGEVAVCILKGGTLDELKEAMGLIEPKAAPAPAPKAPEPETPEEPEEPKVPEPVDPPEDDDEEEDDEPPVEPPPTAKKKPTKKATKKAVRKPRG